MPTTRPPKHYNYFRDYDPAVDGYHDALRLTGITDAGSSALLQGLRSGHWTLREV